MRLEMKALCHTRLWPAGHISVEDRTIAYGAVPPPLTPLHKGEGDFAAWPQSTNLDNFRRNDGVGVSLPLEGRGQGWGYNALCNGPAFDGGEGIFP